MSQNAVYLAIDLGASSGRLVAGSYDGSTIQLEEIHRFANEPVRAAGGFFWDTLRLFHEMKEGLKKAAVSGLRPLSLGIDTWGVDYGLLDGNRNLIGMPYHYRDERTQDAQDRARPLSMEEIYRRTGIQYMPFNTLFQLEADGWVRPAVLAQARHLLLMPDLFGYFLTGEIYSEYTISSTTELLNAGTKQLDPALLELLGLPASLFPAMVQPGTVIGGLLKEVAEETGLGDIRFIAVAEHDTASAVASAPLADENAAYLSCGTWSLLGAEREEPLINGETRAANFTNEGGVEGTIRFLKNTNGLWLMQRLRQSHREKLGEISFKELAEAAQNTKRDYFIVNPDDPALSTPLDMMDAIAGYCERQGQGRPANIGELARAAYNGLGREYQTNIAALERLTGAPVSRLHMVGGGIQDEYLCRLTARVTGKTVAAGPVEASVLGNILMQMKAQGAIASREEGREIVRRSFEQRIYQP